MTIKEQIKILGNKIRSNQAQYDLGRQNAKISALSNGELDKYEYLTSENLRHKLDVVRKAKFEYSPLGQGFNKGLEKDKKTSRFVKRIKSQIRIITRSKKYARKTIKGSKGYDFTNFSSLREPFRVIYYGEILIPAVEREQDNFDGIIEILKVYGPKKDSKYNGLKQDLIINAQNF